MKQNTFLNERQIIMEYELLEDYCKFKYGKNFILANWEDRGTFIEFYKSGDHKEYRVSIFTLISFAYSEIKK